MAFEYRAVTAGGARSKGVTHAPSRAEAFRALSAMGLTPIAIHALHPRRARRARVRPQDIADFTHRLAVLVAARISLAEGLRSIAEQDAGTRLAGIIDDVARRVESGARVADALAVHEDRFGRVYVRTVRAAEESGSLPAMLDYLADMLERQAETRAQARGALMYPLCVCAVLLLALAFMLVFVVPRFAALFAARGVELPALSRALIAGSESVQAFWWVYLPAAAGAAWTLRRFARTERGSLLIDALLHRVPYVGRALRALGIARFAQVLGVCVGSGVGLIDAIRLAGEASGRPLLATDAARMAEQVRVGGRLRAVLETCGYLSPFARRMLGAGEEASDLPRMCELVARQHDRQAAQLLKNLGTVIEPVLVVAIAGAVMVIALSIFLPMWNMASLMGAK
jgi:type II secretory pathway component PulF